MVAYPLFVNTPCCTEVTWNSGAWWSPRLLGVVCGGGRGRFAAVCSGFMNYQQSVSQPRHEKRARGQVYLQTVTGRCRTWPSRDLAHVYQVTTFGSLNTSVSRISSSRNIDFCFKSPLLFCMLWQVITNSRFNLNDGAYLELYLKIEFVPRSKHCVSATKTTLLMVFLENTAVCPENHSVGRI